MKNNTIQCHSRYVMKVMSAVLAMMAAVIIPSILTSCEIDGSAPVGGGNGKPVSASDLQGRTFVHEEYDIDGEGHKVYHKNSITFTSTSQCSINASGYDYAWYDSGWKKDHYDITKSCSYSVSGDKVTLRNYPFYSSPGDLVLTYWGGALMDGSDVYKEK